jgi:peptidoglycan/xylan/chitin deacetylase (PgdA/CDA1 family)
MSNFIKSIQLIGLTKEKPFFAKFKLTFETGEEKHIKISLDKYTYNHLSKVVFSSFSNNHVEGMTCSIPISTPQSNSSLTETEWIIWDAFGQKGKFSYSCSPQYKLSLNKLRRIGSLEEFYEVAIKKKELHRSLPKQITNNTTKKVAKFLLVSLCTLVFALTSSPNTLSGEKQQSIVVMGVNQTQITRQGIDLAVPEYDLLPEYSQEVELTKEKEIVFSVPKGQVALTFDDGPSLYTQEILSILHDYGIRATFFLIGANVTLYPQAVPDIRGKGHAIGFHSYSHRDLRKLSYEEQEEDIIFSLEALKPYLHEVSLFRPPYGVYDTNTQKILKKHGMSLVLWNRDPRDWDSNSPQQVVEAVLNDSPSGGIYLLHENAMTLKALPQIIEVIQGQELEFVALETGVTE